MKNKIRVSWLYNGYSWIREIFFDTELEPKGIKQKWRPKTQLLKINRDLVSFEINKKPVLLEQPSSAKLKDLFIWEE